MSDQFFKKPILNSPYEYPLSHWELVEGLPTQKIIPSRRRAEFITPIQMAFAEFTDTYLIQSELAEKIKAEFNRVIETVMTNQDTL